MTENLKVVIDKPIQVFAFRTQRSRKSVASFGIVCRWIGVVAVVFVVMVAGQINRRTGLMAVISQGLGFCRSQFRLWV